MDTSRQSKSNKSAISDFKKLSGLKNSAKIKQTQTFK